MTTARGRYNEVYEAQADNLATDRAAALLRVSAHVLLAAADAVSDRPTRAARATLKRVLSGVLADVEIVRQAIKE